MENEHSITSATFYRQQKYIVRPMKVQGWGNGVRVVMGRAAEQHQEAHGYREGANATNLLHRQQ